MNMRSRRGNERLRFLTTIGGNLGAGLFASAAARWFAEGVDLYVALWSLLGSLLIWSAWYSLVLLEPEED